MGTEEISRAVVDASPLIHLAEIGSLPLLRIFSALHIPSAVWSESVEQGRVPRDDILSLGIVQQHSVPQPAITQFIEQNDLEALHQGERECMYLCQDIGVPILLTDDLAVREAAKRLNLTPVGSLGIVVRAYRLGEIALVDAERQITNLYNVSSLFVTRTIVDLAIEELRKHT